MHEMAPIPAMVKACAFTTTHSFIAKVTSGTPCQAMISRITGKLFFWRLRQSTRSISYEWG
jgi:hypothetical protein